MPGSRFRTTCLLIALLATTWPAPADAQLQRIVDAAVDPPA